MAFVPLPLVGSTLRHWTGLDWTGLRCFIISDREGGGGVGQSGEMGT